MKKITFVTRNTGKIATAQQYLDDVNVELEPYDYEFVEPQENEIQEITKSKVLQAYELVKQPCIALDAGFYIDELNGFPKAFTNFALETIGIEGFMKLMQGVEIDIKACGIF